MPNTANKRGFKWNGGVISAQFSFVRCAQVARAIRIARSQSARHRTMSLAGVRKSDPTIQIGRSRAALRKACRSIHLRRGVDGVGHARKSFGSEMTGVTGSMRLDVQICSTIHGHLVRPSAGLFP